MPELIPAVPGSPEWLAARRAGVTATDIPVILGLSSWNSAYSLYWQKMGQVPEVEDNDRFRLGRFLEDYVVHRWDWDNPGVLEPGGLYRHSERTWQMASPDRVMINNPPMIEAVLEVKTWADAARDQWQDGPPPAVRAQVLWQMDVMDVATGHVGVVFLPSGEFRSYVIEHIGNCPRCDGLGIGCTACPDIDLMRAAGEEFIAQLRHELPAPDPDASAATLAAVRARFTRQPDKEAEIEKVTWVGYALACDRMRKFEEQKRDWEIKLREQAGEASVLTVDGQPVARRVVSDAQVKAHTRHSDYLKRIKTEADSE